ncbi:MAG: hypothetical protein JWO96_31 [Candidatus Saccharibacteria bacterium]|nr:hypothetical protein [Candidatus Saccharibacteria bacterium]
MRLFLSSYRAGRHTDRLKELLGDVKKVGVITNAKDYKTPEGRRERVGEVFEFFESLGLEPKEVDLRPFFNKSGAPNQLIGYNFVWLAGGNPFLLRRALKYSGVDDFLISRVRDGSIIYGGESAGALIVGPTLRYAEMDSDEDSPDYVAEGYKKEVIWDGLGFTDYMPVPHYQSEEYGPETQSYIQRLDQAVIKHKEMTDDQAILINNSKEEFLK